MKSLKRITVENVTSNLYLNYELCLKYDWKIPKRIGDEIFEFAFKYGKPLNDNDTLFFQRKITELSEFCTGIGRFNVKNYNFLLDHELNNFCVRYVNNINIDWKFGKIITENFKIIQNETPDSGMENIFKECLIVKTSIKVNLSDNNRILKGIFSMIENSKLNLKKLSIKCNNINWKYFKRFFKSLPELKNLEKLKLTFNRSYILDKSYGNILFESLIPLSNNLKSLKIYEIPFSYSKLIDLLEKCKILEKISIQLTNWNDDLIESDVIKCLSKNNQYLKKININFSKVNKSIIEELMNLINNCKLLLKFRIHSRREVNLNVDKIFQSLLKFTDKLQYFDVFGMYTNSNLLNLNKLFYCCKSLTKIDVTHYCNVKIILPSLEIAIKQSKNTLKEISFPGFMADELIFCLKVLIDTNRLEYLYFEQCSNNTESDNILRRIIEGCRDRLKSFSWLGHFSESTFDIELLNCLSNCSMLTKLQIVDLDLKKKLNYLINRSSKYLENLQELCLMSIGVDEEDIFSLGATLDNCYNLRELELAGTFASTMSTIYFCEKTKHLQLQLEEFSRPKKCMFSEDEDEDGESEMVTSDSDYEQDG